MDQREASIVAQVAAKVAGQIYAAQTAAGGDVNEFGAIAGTVMDTIVELTAQYAVVAQFPGTEVVPSQPNPFPGAPQVQGGQTSPFAGQMGQTNIPPQVAQFPQQQPGQMPQAPPGVAFDKWADFRTNYGNWEDRRAQKAGNPKKPDFVHRFQPDPKNSQYKVSIYLTNDDTPYDIKQAFGLVQ